eukprot:GHVS01076313.1.p2 GENE.GHVS01076313.1~~GHVS01076313.1.p2  ORF type:complete len:138 (-),score=51.96 GHVS01076313.1:654-1067(-)
MALARGRCKWFNSQKGFGFIQLDNGEEVFVHQSEIYATGFRSLAEGEQIECEVITDDTGKKKAIKVTGPNGSTVQGESRRPYGGGNGGGNGGGGGGGGSGDRWGGGGGSGNGNGGGGGGQRYGSGNGGGGGGGGQRY